MSFHIRASRLGHTACLVAASALVACVVLAPLGAQAAAPQTPLTPAVSPAPASPAPAASPSTASSGVPALEDRQSLEAFLDGVFEVAMEEHHVSGAVISVVKDGQLLFAKGYGYQDLDKRIPVDPRTTLFRIGSTTKLLTWTAVMQLVEQGKLDLDADVNTYLEGLQIPAAYGKPVTLRHIMTHTAGFEDGFLGYLIQNDPQTQLPIAAAMKEHLPARVRPPGEMSAYSNYATALAGLIVERVSGQPYNDYIERHIFEPLDMQFATVQEPVPARLQPYVATSYKQENGAPVAQKFEIVGGFRPAGSGAVSAVDMAHFAIAHLQDGRYGERTILSPETARRMHARAFELDPRFPGMALGFYQSSINGLELIGHGGDTMYCHSDLLLVPSRQLGVFMSFYAEESGARTRVTRAFFDRYFPAAEADAASAPGPAAVEAAQRYAGSYHFTRRNYSKMEKALDLFTQVSVGALPDGNLVVSGLADEPWQFRPAGTNLYRRIGGPERLAFRADASGRPTHLFFDFLPFMPTERTPWYDSAGVWFTALAAAFLIFVSALVRLGFRRRELAALPAAQRRAEWTAAGVSAWAVFTVLGLAAAIVIPGADTIFMRIPLSLKLALVMPVIFVAAAVVLLVMTVRVWRARFWTVPRRARFSLVTLAAVILSLYFWHWNVLGWQFG